MADSPEIHIGNLLRQKGWQLVTAESCTGGLIAHRITNVPGSSDYFDRGFICYSNQAKEELLGVPAATLREHGAVSAQTAIAMAQGARERSRADVAVAVTGIAGPGGGTPASVRIVGIRSTRLASSLVREPFGTALAEWLDGLSPHSVRCAVDGEPLAEVGGRIVMAPSDRHLARRADAVRRRGARTPDPQYSSSVTWKLLPPKPNELTPTISGPSGQGSRGGPGRGGLI